MPPRPDCRWLSRMRCTGREFERSPTRPSLPSQRDADGRTRPRHKHLTTLIEIKLHEGPGRVIGIEIEFRPEPVELLLALLVQNQFLQRIVVAPETHDAVITSAEQTPGVRRIVREELAALLYIERVREHMGET